MDNSARGVKGSAVNDATAQASKAKRSVGSSGSEDSVNPAASIKLGASVKLAARPATLVKPAASVKLAAPVPKVPVPNQREKIERLASEFESSRKLLMALGDESRMHIVLTMMRMGDCSGVRALEVAERTSLSRPAVSHHLQILKDAGILKTRKEGTKIYYYFDPDMRSMSTLIDALRLSIEITRDLPDRSGE